jgi:hypothetical protein
VCTCVRVGVDVCVYMCARRCGCVCTCVCVGVDVCVHVWMCVRAARAEPYHAIYPLVTYFSDGDEGCAPRQRRRQQSAPLQRQRRRRGLCSRTSAVCVRVCAGVCVLVCVQLQIGCTRAVPQDERLTTLVATATGDNTVVATATGDNTIVATATGDIDRRHRLTAFPCLRPRRRMPGLLPHGVEVEAVRAPADRPRPPWPDCLRPWLG